MAGNRVSFFGEQKNDADTIVLNDTVHSAKFSKNVAGAALDSATIQALDTLDSLHRAIFLRNKAIDDSISLDSVNRRKKNGIDAPVEYTADDSLVYFAGNKMAHLYGSSTVKYENMDLASEKVAITLDSSLVRATGVYDSATHGKIGTPVFKMGSDSYESDTMAFNFDGWHTLQFMVRKESPAKCISVCDSNMGQWRVQRIPGRPEFEYPIKVTGIGFKFYRRGFDLLNWVRPDSDAIVIRNLSCY